MRGAHRARGVHTLELGRGLGLAPVHGFVTEAEMACSHLEMFTRSREAPVTPSAEGCEECLRTGQRWVQLRLCMTCGHVGCCDSSPGHHATGHYHDTQHPVMKAYEPGQSWAWCYVDEEMVKSIPAFPQESPAEHFTASP